MKDYLVKAIAFDGQVRAYASVTTQTVSEAQRRHQTLPTASAALGRTMSVAVMMGAMLKGEERLTVKLEGNGPTGAIIVDTNARGEVRGYMQNPKVDVPRYENGKLAVADAVGRQGFLTIVKDLGMRENFSGTVPLVSGEIGDDFTYYFTTSEQVPSAVGVGVLVNPDQTILASGGFIIQLMPGATDETISKIESQISHMQNVSELIHKGYRSEEMLYEVLGKEEVTILEQMDVKFSCSCSKERFASALVSLGVEELNQIIEEDGEAETACQFCEEVYHFSKEELEQLARDASEKRGTK